MQSKKQGFSWLWALFELKGDMKFKSPLITGRFVKRYKRFFADFEHQGQVYTAHVPNTGSLLSVNVPGQACRVSPADNPERKLRYTLEMIQAPTGAWVGVNTSTPNTIVREFLENEYPGKVKAEYKISAETRLDFAIDQGDGKMHFIEVKNVTYLDGETARFPDAVTERGQKHLRELMSLIEQGHTAEIIFTIQRNDAKQFSTADSIDPEYGRLLREAMSRGLKVSPYVVELNESEVRLSKVKLPVV